MEALHAGLPVVVSDVGGAREQVGEHGSRGYLISNPLGDPLAVNWASIRSVCYERQANRDELVAAMRAVIADREGWARKREKLATESQERFRADRCARAHAALLQSVVDDRSSSLDAETSAIGEWVPAAQ
jgi:glycosyltransferase involved in cell wall biosynthesis